MATIGLRHYRDTFDSKAHESSKTIHQVVGVAGRSDVDGLIHLPGSINDEAKIFGVDSTIYPNGIKLVKTSITLAAPATYSMVFEEWNGSPIAHSNDIVTVTTPGSDYAEVLAASMGDSTVAAGAHIYLHIPATVVDWVEIKIVYDVL